MCVDEDEMGNSYSDIKKCTLLLTSLSVSLRVGKDRNSLFGDVAGFVFHSTFDMFTSSCLIPFSVFGVLSLCFIYLLLPFYPKP